jgi:benzil reductase ((S)-benzoin forming)
MVVVAEPVFAVSFRTVIVTGANRGLGLALAKALTVEHAHIIVVARQSASVDQSLEKLCADKSATLSFVVADMSDVDSLASKFASQVVPLVDVANSSELLFVQNAGVACTQLCGTHTGSQIKDVMVVNSIAPLVLMDAFVRAFGDAPIDKRMLLIGSGAGRRAMSGWTAYGASKAALDHMARILKEEQTGRAHPIRVCSYGPGVVETDMQIAIRNTPADDIPVLKKLREMKETGQVMSAERSAEVATNYFLLPTFGDDATEDIYNILK